MGKKIERRILWGPQAYLRVGPTGRVFCGISGLSSDPDRPPIMAWLRQRHGDNLPLREVILREIGGRQGPPSQN